MKKSIQFLAAILLTAQASFGFASVINVGGVTWDPDFDQPAMPPFVPASSDMIQKVSFTQWFVGAADAGTIDSGAAIDPGFFYRPGRSARRINSRRQRYVDQPDAVNRQCTGWLCSCRRSDGWPFIRR